MDDYRGNNNFYGNSTPDNNGNFSGSYNNYNTGNTTGYNNTSGSYNNYNIGNTTGYNNTSENYNTGNYSNNYNNNYNNSYNNNNFSSNNYSDSNYNGYYNPYSTGTNNSITYQSGVKGFHFKLPRLKTIFIFGIIIGLIILAGVGNKRSQAQKQAEQALMSAGVDMIQYPHAYTKEDVVEILNKMIEEDAENFYMDVETTVSKDDLSEVAKEIDPFVGRLSMFSYSMMSTQYEDGSDPIHKATAGVNFTFERSIESYVYNDIKYGKPIPEDNKEALKVKAECEAFLRDNIEPGMTEYDKEVAVHDFIVNKCTYDKSDLDDLTIYSSYGVLINGRAVCEGYARTTALLLKLLDVDVELISGDAKGEMAGGSDLGHMWNQVCIDGVWYHYDATWDDPTGDSDVLAHLYLNVSDQILSLDHEWDQSKYHTCNSMEQNYYKKQGMYFTDDASFQEYVKNQLASGERSCIKCTITDIDLSEDTMSFIFNYDGITSYQFMTIGIDGYQYLEIKINV